MCSPQIHRSRHTLLLRRRPLNDRLTSIRFAFVEPSACSLLLWLARVEPRTRIGLNGILLSNLWILSSLLFSAGIRLLRINLANRSSFLFPTLFHCKGRRRKKAYLRLRVSIWKSLSSREGSEKWNSCEPITIIKVNIHSFARSGTNSFALTRT